MFILAFASWRIRWSPCIPQDISFNYFTKEELTSTSATKLWIYKASFIETSQKLYLYGGVTYSSANDFVFMRKQDMDGNIAWTKFQSVSSYTYNGFDVAPNEGYLYFIEQITQVNIYIFGASTGNYSACSYYF